MSLQIAMLIGLLAPLVVAVLTPFLAVRHVWRDAAGPVGGVITFIAAVEVALAVLDGETPRLFVAQIAEGLAIEFAVTPLGAIFGLVDPAFGFWLLSIRLDICAAIMKSIKPGLRLFTPLLFMRQWQWRGRAIFLCFLSSMRFLRFLHTHL